MSLKVGDLVYYESRFQSGRLRYGKITAIAPCHPGRDDVVWAYWFDTIQEALSSRERYYGPSWVRMEDAHLVSDLLKKAEKPKKGYAKYISEVEARV